MLQLRFTIKHRVYLLTVGHDSPWKSSQMALISYIREDYNEHGEVDFAWYLWDSDWRASMLIRKLRCVRRKISKTGIRVGNHE